MMKHLWLVGAFALTSAWAGAATLPAEKLLPADTLGLLTVPDWNQVKAIFRDSSFGGGLWSDPVMKPFKEKFLENFSLDVIQPLERELKVKLSDYADLLQGQVTLAFTKITPSGQTNLPQGWILLIDTQGKKAQLEQQLAEVKKRWIESGKLIKTETIRGIEFTTLMVNSADLRRTFQKIRPFGQPAASDEPVAAESVYPLSFGQSDALLIIGNQPAEIEKVLIRQAGGLVPALAEQPAFEANSQALFRQSFLQGWVNFKPIYDEMLRQRKASQEPAPKANPLAPPPDKLLAALGLGDLKTLAFNAERSSDGMLFNFFLGVPEAQRRGLFKLLTLESKEAAPPPFIPADAVKFSRVRLDGKTTWAALEAMVAELSPEMAGLLQLGLMSAGKDKDPNFDLKRSFIGNLGDDFITIQKNPRSGKLEDLSSPPSLYLLGSANTEQLAHGLKVAASMVPPPLSKLTEREFLGRKIHTIQLPPAQGARGTAPSPRRFHFAASGSYLALSTDEALLEEYLRSAEGSGKSLRDLTGLNEAAQKVGGMGTGWFSYENQSETMRYLWDNLKKNPEALGASLSGSSLSPRRTDNEDSAKALKNWLDVSLLPPFQTVAKYFHFTVSTLSSKPDGLTTRSFLPDPPASKK